MFSIKQIIQFLQTIAPTALQEPYDNSGLLTGDENEQCTGIICALDTTEEVIHEAIIGGANLIVTHHPTIFKPIKSLNASRNVGRILTKAIKNDIGIYAIHTNYDNVLNGVNLALALEIGLKKDSLSILAPMQGKLCKLFTYVPIEFAEQVKTSLFEAGAGKIGLYEECSFELSGMGTFKPKEGSHPFIGKAAGERETVAEAKLEVIFPIWLKNNIIQTLKKNHPYEEVAYEIMLTENQYQEVGAGMIGELTHPMEASEFLENLKKILGIKMIRHTEFTKNHIQKIAICGGAGSFLIEDAIAAKADVFITADLKYHDFFEADGSIILVDIGHYESEIVAITQLTKVLKEKFPTFAVLQTKVITNPVNYR